jgi:4-coumarate--CoA ligase
MPIWTWLFDSSASTLTTFPPSKVCSFVDSTTHESLNYNTVAELSTYASTVLSRHHGLQPGETVCFFSHNTIWYPVAMFAALRSGGVISGASPSYTEDEMTFALKTVNAKYIFTVPGSVEIAVAAAARAGIPKDKIFLLEGMRAGYKTLKELVEVGRREQTQMPAFDLGGRDSGEVCAYLSFSSGTTGLPKAVSFALL